MSVSSLVLVCHLEDLLRGKRRTGSPGAIALRQTLLDVRWNSIFRPLMFAWIPGLPIKSNCRPPFAHTISMASLTISMHTCSVLFVVADAADIRTHQRHLAFSTSPRSHRR